MTNTSTYLECRRLNFPCSTLSLHEELVTHRIAWIDPICHHVHQMQAANLHHCLPTIRHTFPYYTGSKPLAPYSPLELTIQTSTQMGFPFFLSRNSTMVALDERNINVLFPLGPFPRVLPLDHFPQVFPLGSFLRCFPSGAPFGSFPSGAFPRVLSLDAFLKCFPWVHPSSALPQVHPSDTFARALPWVLSLKYFPQVISLGYFA